MKVLTAGLLVVVLVLAALLLSARRTISLKSVDVERLTAELREAQALSDERRTSQQPIQSPGLDRSELMKLRAEVTRLRGEAADRAGAAGAGVRAIPIPAPNPTTLQLAGDRLFLGRTNQPVTAQDEGVRQALNEKEANLQGWWKAFKTYAEQHGGELPIEFADAAAYLPTDFQTTIDLSNFVRSNPTGPPANLKAMENPKRTAIFKERVPLTLSDGTVCNMWLFADGSVELFQE